MSGPAVSRKTPYRSAPAGSGMTLIEASAGTGKTRALTGIVASLVARDGRRLDEILVVTFTRAATAELRERIRGALRDARHAVVTEESGEGTQARELLARWGEDPSFEPQAAARRLEAALRDVDRANVFTIHGFCQRVLSDLAFDGGFPFGFEVSGDDGELVTGAAHDFWRRRMYCASRALAGYALEKGFRPDDLAGWVRRWRGKPDLRIEGGDPPEVPLERREAAWRAAVEEARAEWSEHREAFLDEVLNGSWLSRSKFRAPRTQSELASIEALLDDPEPLPPPEGRLGRYGAQSLADACKKGHDLPANPLFGAFDRLEVVAADLRSACEAWLRSARREILAEARDSIRRRVREDRCLGYDDLLLELFHALRSDGGERLAERIRSAYPLALIDEFQDTDPVQAEVFMRVYGRPGRRPGEDREEGTGVAGPEDPRDAATPAGAPGGGIAPGGSPPEEEGTAASGTDSGNADAGGLRVVGDPKQSIYRFRGADVYAYLRARGAARARHSLVRNWRSVPALVEGVNAVFARSNPFAVPEIGYPEVTPGRGPENPLRIEGEAGGAPLRVRLLPERPDAKRWNKGEAAELAASAVAEEVARMLLLAENGKATIDEPPSEGGGDRRLTGADIAVLVPTRSRGRQVAEALRDHNVASVEVGEESVFDSGEAEQMERLLWALVEPGREARVRGALTGDLFGLDTRALFAFEEDEEAWAEWSNRLRAWRADWSASGVGPVLRRLVEVGGGGARLLRHRDGARRLTNVRHLTEILQTAEAEQRMAPAALAVWFSRRRAEARTRDEEAELRIESDEELVRILTVHGAKGLEFPVVFLPFAWDARDPSRGRAEYAAYHGNEADGFPEVLDLEPDEDARAVARREELSEELRLLYVALTRAKYRCVVTWGQVRFAERAPLAWLLHRGEKASGPSSPTSGAPDPVAAPLEARNGGSDSRGHGPLDDDVAGAEVRFAGLDGKKLHGEVHGLAASRPEAISVTVLDPDPSSPATVLPAPPTTPLAARRLDRPFPRTRQLTSFSALSAATGRAGPDGPQGPPGAEPDSDRPDHDQHEAQELADEEALPAEGDEGRTAFTFPRGPAAGSCLHRIFERLDELTGASPDLEGICREELAAFGFAGEWSGVARAMVERARAVRLEAPGGPANDPRAGPEEAGAGFRLADPVPRLVELDFAFPVSGLDRARLGACLREGGYPDPFPPSPDAPPDEPPPSIDGFLRGFVDLVVEHRGRWYVIDYKSNWLGPSPAGYSPEAVAAAMRAGAYSLQYLLYLVALHRYLGLRLPGYAYERHIGGAFYLFVRGMDPAAGMGRGVWFDRPEASVVHGLDRLFREIDA